MAHFMTRDFTDAGIREANPPNEETVSIDPGSCAEKFSVREIVRTSEKKKLDEMLSVLLEQPSRFEIRRNGERRIA